MPHCNTFPTKSQGVFSPRREERGAVRHPFPLPSVLPSVPSALRISIDLTARPQPAHPLQKGKGFFPRRDETFVMEFRHNVHIGIICIRDYERQYSTHVLPAISWRKARMPGRHVPGIGCRIPRYREPGFTSGIRGAMFCGECPAKLPSGCNPDVGCELGVDSGDCPHAARCPCWHDDNPVVHAAFLSWLRRQRRE